MYHGFYTLRGRKFPHGNFRTSVFCEVKTQIVGETVVSRQAHLGGKWHDKERTHDRGRPPAQGRLSRGGLRPALLF